MIDCVATDHAPHARHEKEVPFEQAPMGTTGLETAFAALYTELVLRGELELPIGDRADDRRRGALRPADAEDRDGRAANLSLIDLDASLGGRRCTGTSAGRRTAASTVARCTGA